MMEALPVNVFIWDAEAVVRRCSVEKVFLDIWQNSQENTCTRVTFLIKLPAFQAFQPVSVDGITWQKTLTLNFNILFWNFNYFKPQDMSWILLFWRQKI